MEHLDLLNQKIKLLESRIDKQEGYITGMNIVLQGILLTHPDRQKVVDAITAQFTIWEAAATYQPIPETTLAAIGDGVGRAIAPIVRIPEPPAAEG